MGVMNTPRKRPFKPRKKRSRVPPAILAAYLARPSVGTGNRYREQPLKPSQTETIFQLWKERKATQVELAVRYNTTQTAISRLIRAKMAEKKKAA